MYYIQSESGVQDVCDRLHAYLQASRPGYAADLWDTPHPNSGATLYATSLPPEWPAVLTESEAADVVEALPVGFTPEETP